MSKNKDTLRQRVTSVVRSVVLWIQRIITSRLFGQIFRFGIAGGASFVVDYFLFLVLLRYFEVYYINAALISFIAAVIVNWILNSLWVFKERRIKYRWGEAILFILIAVIGLGINELTLWICVEHVHLYPELAKVIATVIVAIWSFTIRKLLLYK